ncbi:sensor histidine kinase [Streptomyces sp. WMMC940]|uniref:sensor histidine kinase n=1 Tax=Streptomyces sp. WMMC940 TaxID=3015153 RepID=UPI0022B6543C|nr:ATP-binding protein [Streptomyces sp. WMMC940]MCZ7456295.1 ATP-binding protein [Streptomyces sp. WMMC940]
MEAAQDLDAARSQSLVRLLIVALLVVQLVLFPPLENEGACRALVAGYALWAVVLTWAAWGGSRPLPQPWRLLLFDLLVLGAMLAMAGGFATPPGIRPLVDDAFFLIPVLAAFQTSPWVTAAMTGASALAYLLAVQGVGTGAGWGRTALLVLSLLLLGAVCTALTRVQRDRVSSVGVLLERSRELLGQAMNAEERERRNLAEALHDEALQDVLAARQDLDEARGADRREALERADRALGEAARRMRSVVRELHPAVLEHLGLSEAVQSLAESAAQRGGFDVRVHRTPVPPSPFESIAFAAARELLVNVVKHAEAREVEVRLEAREGFLRLLVADDGRGLPPRAPDESVRSGHIGLASLRVRVETVGGRFRLEPRDPSGTAVVVEIPLEPVVRSGGD